jgi:RNA polymerase sigma-70 factor (sigma-E family)
VSTRIQDQRRPVIARHKREKAPPSFEAFYRQEYAPMVAIARALVAERSQAEDLVQESFISAHRHWSRVGTYDQPRLWVRRVMINRATSLRRRLGSEWRAMTRLRAEPLTRPASDLSLPTLEVWEEVRRLPVRQQQVVVLHYISDLKVAEIGETLGLARGTVKAHLHRARQQLKTTLSAWEED